MCDQNDADTRYGDEISILIVGLDAWKFQTHSITQGAIEHSSTCEGSCVLHAGSISVEDTCRFFNILEKLLVKAQSKKGEARSAASNNQGHQKTPSFIDALVRDAMRKLRRGEDGSDCASQPRGGFTDVGLHTGGEARNTAWPLFKESLKTILQYSSVYQSPSAELFECILAHFHLWLLNRQVALLTPQNATQLMVNATMKMLELSSNAAAELIDHGFVLGQAEDSCQKARMQLEAIALQRAELAARHLQFCPE
ncbi:hypothetical protein KSW81_002679 [Nannochloris sp. 'desiccata']|nr:hypothetical protein KSW81_002679 [Chlorella desiccata (nom. nud.)]